MGRREEDPKQSIMVSVLYLLWLHEHISLCNPSHGGFCKKYPLYLCRCVDVATFRKIHFN